MMFYDHHLHMHAYTHPHAILFFCNDDPDATRELNAHDVADDDDGDDDGDDDICIII